MHVNFIDKTKGWSYYGLGCGKEGCEPETSVDATITAGGDFVSELMMNETKLVRYKIESSKYVLRSKAEWGS